MKTMKRKTMMRKMRKMRKMMMKNSMVKMTLKNNL
jgi:hypothetical protein